MSFVDREITCIDCSQPFVFTAGEQEFYERKGFREEPKRCKPCRDNRKARRGDAPVARSGGGNGGGARGGGVGNFNGGGGGEEDDNIGNRADGGGGGARGGGFGGGGGRGGPRPHRGGGGGGGGGDREMFDATCAQCGAAARVPFRPTPGRPVFCRDCFSSGAAGGARG